MCQMLIGWESITHNRLVQTEVGHSLQVKHGQVALATADSIRYPLLMRAEPLEPLVSF